MSGFEPVSVYGNYFVGIDGEGTVGDDYSLLDCSLDEYPRLYTGRRLTSLECLDWLWGLAKHAGFCQFVVYGARYDYDNWMRDLPSEAIPLYANGYMVRIGPYAVVWKRGYKWELRKVEAEHEDGTITRYERIRTRNMSFGHRQDKIGLTVWDVVPWWQKKFADALPETLGDEAIDVELIEEGKKARGTFTHDNIEWVSRYNKAECKNLAYMMVKLDAWLESVGIRPNAYNGPGAAAKALLQQYRPFEHAGRRIVRGRHGVKSYEFPGWESSAALTAARSAYAGGRNQLLKMGYRPGVSWSYDINSAYPAATCSLPCLSHGRWKRTLEFDPSSFGLWRIKYRASREMKLYPFFWRDPDGSIAYPSAFEERWIYTSELAAGMAVDQSGISIREGRVWDHDICDCPNPFWWVRQLSQDRLRYKREGNRGAALGLKLPLNSLYGSLAQARGGSGFVQAPWSQQLLWAGDITAFTRAKLYLAAMLDPDNMYHLATDGIICGERLPLNVGDGLGQWEESTMTDLSLVQYGVYFAQEKSRWRGFDLALEDVPSFVRRVHEAWCSPWRSLSVSQRLFVTSGLVATGQKTYDEWCTWEDASRTLNLDVSTPYEQGAVKSVDRLYDVYDMTRYNNAGLPASTLYQPKWGIGGGFPWEERDAVEEAFEAAV